METNYSLANLGKRKKKTSSESRPVMITILSESRAERPLLESGWRRRHGAVRGGHRTWQGGRRTQWTKAGKWVMAGQWADKDRKEVGLSKRYERDSGGDTRPRTCSTYNYNSRAGISLHEQRVCVCVCGWSGEGSFLNTLLKRARGSDGWSVVIGRVLYETSQIRATVSVSLQDTFCQYRLLRTYCINSISSSLY